MRRGSLDEVRAEIDRIDDAIIRLIAERGAFVAQAAHFKKNAGVCKTTYLKSRPDEKFADLCYTICK